jgi:YHS domain-containing protein
MLRVFLIILLVYVAARVLWRVLRGVFEGLGYQQTGSAPSSVGLVRDPVCGTFVLPSKALTAGSGSNTRYFCSEKCRQDYSHSGNTEETRNGNTEETRKRRA